MGTFISTLDSSQLSDLIKQYTFDELYAIIPPYEDTESTTILTSQNYPQLMIDGCRYTMNIKNK